MRLILILTHAEYENGMRLMKVSNGIGRVAENDFELGYIRPTLIYNQSY